MYKTSYKTEIFELSGLVYPDGFSSIVFTNIGAVACSINNGMNLRPNFSLEFKNNPDVEIADAIDIKGTRLVNSASTFQSRVLVIKTYNTMPKKYKVTYKTQFVTSNQQVSPEGCTSILFQQISSIPAIINNGLTLNIYPLEFNNEPGCIITDPFDVKFLNPASPYCKIFIMKTFYTEVL